MAINQESAFHRVYVDLPTPLAVRVDAMIASGQTQHRTKKEFIARAIEVYMAQVEGEPAPRVPTSSKPRRNKTKGN